MPRTRQSTKSDASSKRVKVFKWTSANTQNLATEAISKTIDDFITLLNELPDSECTGRLCDLLIGPRVDGNTQEQTTEPTGKECLLISRIDADENHKSKIRKLLDTVKWELREMHSPSSPLAAKDRDSVQESWKRVEQAMSYKHLLRIKSVTDVIEDIEKLGPSEELESKGATLCFMGCNEWNDGSECASCDAKQDEALEYISLWLGTKLQPLGDLPSSEYELVKPSTLLPDVSLRELAALITIYDSVLEDRELHHRWQAPHIESGMWSLGGPMD